MLNDEEEVAFTGVRVPVLGEPKELSRIGPMRPTSRYDTMRHRMCDLSVEHR